MRMQVGRVVRAAAVWVLYGLTFSASAADALRVLTEQDADAWRDLAAVHLSPDGRWFAYLINPMPGVPHQNNDGVVVVRSVLGATERRYPIGDMSQGAGNLKISPSGRWIAFQTASHDGLRTSSKNHLDVSLVELESGALHPFKAIQSFEFIGGAAERLLFQGYSQEEESTFTIATHSLKTGSVKPLSEQAFAGVTRFVVSPHQSHLAWINAAGLHIYNFKSGQVRDLDQEPGARYLELQWSDSGNALAVLRETASGLSYLTFTGLHEAAPKADILTADTCPDFPSGYRLTPSLRWRADDAGLFFGIQAIQPNSKPQTLPALALWHWRDEQIPPQKKAKDALPPEYREINWCYTSLTDRRVVRLSDEQLRNVELHSRGRYVLGYDMRAYGWHNRLNVGGAASQLRDYYLVELSTGKRELLFRGLQVVTRPGLSVLPRLSPDGLIALYQDNEGDYIAYNTQSGKQRNLTAGLPTTFYFKENAPREKHKLRDSYGQGHPLLQGWAANGTHVLLSDYYDIWALPLKDGQAINLTGSGKRENVWYTRVALSTPVHGWSAPVEDPVDLQEPLYFELFDLKSGETGLARRVPGRSNLEILHREYAELRYYKAEQADIHLLSRSSATETYTYYRVNKNWKPGKQLTNINPQQRRFQWTPGTKYLSYTNSRSDERHALLRLPVDYVEGRLYPTVVEIYKGSSATVHLYPRPYSSDQKDEFLRHGYAVLQPDIEPRLNEAGQAAIDDVTSAIDAAVATGVVDRARLGLFGHSFGGWETALIASRTDLFKAAVDYAGMTNLWSFCTTMTNWSCESDQPYFSGPWWEQWNSYLSNSPIYHARELRTPLLIAHGDQDFTVPVSQALELFNTLRRMGDKPVVLLEYKGEEHDFSRGPMRDFYQRRLEFFNHFLKSAPAPTWWSDGISYYEGQVPLSYSSSQN